MSGVITPSYPIGSTLNGPGLTVENLLSVEEFRENIQYQPYHFWGLSGQLAPTSNCNTLVPEYSYQMADIVGRRSVQESIQKAEENLKPWLGYYPAPRYVEENIAFPKFPKADISRLGYAGIDDRWISVNVENKYVQAVGVEAISMILENQAVVYSDMNGDGLNDTFTVTVPLPTGITDYSQVCLYFSSTERFTGSGYEERWRVRPLRYRVSGLNLIMTGPSWLLVKPVKYETMTMPSIDASLAANFATTLDVCSRQPSQEGQTLSNGAAVLIWESPPYPQINYNVVFPGSDPAGLAWSLARATIKDPVNGVVGIGEALYNTTTGAWESVPWYSSIYKFRPPDRVILRYLAGYPTDSMGRMAHDMATCVTRLAAAELPNRICACDAANKELYQWQFDTSRSSGPETYGYISREDLNNPFGPRRGQLYAWKFIKARRVLTGYVP